MSDPRAELTALSSALRGHIERERAHGRRYLVSQELQAAISAPVPVPASRPESVARSLPVETAGLAPSTSARGKKLGVIEIEPERPGAVERASQLAQLAEEASTCTLCGLCKTRTKVVFARGRGRNRVMFIGEAPGADEDRLGEPFVGRAGKLLDQILDAAGFQRDEIYVANILKCRPPENRDPRPEEIASCTPYLERQIELVEPKIICALGKFAGQFLTGKLDAPIGQLRGRIHYYRDRIMVLPTYHPAALLRNPALKRTVWEDMQLLREEYLR